MASVSSTDLAVDHALAEIAASFSFLLDVTPVELVDARERFWTTGRAPVFEYRPVETDLEVAERRLRALPCDDVMDPSPVTCQADHVANSTALNATRGVLVLAARSSGPSSSALRVTHSARRIHQRINLAGH